MRRLGLGGMATALIVGLGAAVATTRGSDYDGKAPVAKGLLSGLFGEKPKSPALVDKEGGAVKTEPTVTVESAAALQHRHMNALLRRMEVCDRLQLIANQTGDESLMNRAFELQERANDIYRRQTAGLPLPTSKPVAVPADDARLANSPTLSGSSGSVLAREAEEATALPQQRRPLTTDATSRLGGSMDQREQAILNGTSMGGNNP